MKFTELLRERKLEHECEFFVSRSGGPGGQHVNKVNTKVELRFPLLQSSLLGPEEKEIIHARLFNRINEEGVLIVRAQQSRSQLTNKENAIARLYELLAEALMPRKKRVKTRPGILGKQQRLDEKKRISQKKTSRRKWEGNGEN